MLEYQLNNVDETQGLAESIGKVLLSGDCLVLTGELGAGKTTFTKGLGIGLGIEQMIKSPTYTIVREYRKGRLPLFHMDVYRLEEGAGDLGLEEYFEAEGVSVVEWGQMIAEELPSSYLEIILSYQEAEDSRKLVLKPVGERATDLVSRIEKAIKKAENP
ncbi:tRNA (adenosine(37)-N6)-threonylcarbamoyltransferase complex ATPase subunit type 1 TsaE [Vagococcus salmoninarum]|uniref:tRNA (adenosine(37)-N6)-threonylcarbamoyltransferase complex ATPase subunit type 1 TsaE n=1 Tax=Vagococcus salmoninarum TaxID=2739 RepID=UPI00187EDEF8|nr:tRNA (adenosine(37)-N6)-threonylcarbamoyltransferase complex ATPase subunit type 1 TsaE [Vagococcus salmoninarum]MBE9389668.1 tRNA (adenosine(37)-N6)-threonylcarbamoyltransferase complex ATPase subunit type 1 TsaE [Vagococcus salmoninarum]